MPRPVKGRRVCCMPESTVFGPLDKGMNEDVIIMTVDEYETIRLIDLENLTQEECAARMNVARTTVQRIYMNARKKLASSLVEGYRLRIEGGDVEICNDDEFVMGCGKHCRRRNRGRAMVIALDVAMAMKIIFK